MIKELFNRIAETLGSAQNGGYPKASIDKNIIAGYNQTRKEGARGSFCFAPGTNMLFSQDGKVRVCCHNEDFVMGTYPQQTLKEMWHGEGAQQMRQHMKNFNLLHGCEVCELDVKLRSYDEVRARHFDSLPANPDYPVMMEFLLTNTCNLECVMCRGEYSSLIRKNREKLPALVSPYDKAFLEQLEEFIPHLHETRFSGSGEAFAIDMNYEIWEMIIRLNPKCVIMVQTNGTYLNARIKDILSRGNFRIGVSLDSLNKETYESIRVNASFDRVMENIEYFSNYSKERNQKFALALCVMRQNWRELPEFVKLSNERNAVATLHKVWFPREYALHNLGYRELTEIHDYLSAAELPAKSPLEQFNAQHYKYMVQVIKKWQEDAFLSMEESGYVQTLSGPGLLPYVQTKLRAKMAENRIPEPEIEKTLQLCTGKLEQVLATYKTPDIQEDILRQICQVPAAEMLKALKFTPVSILIALAKKFLVAPVKN